VRGVAQNVDNVISTGCQVSRCIFVRIPRRLPQGFRRFALDTLACRHLGDAMCESPASSPGFAVGYPIQNAARPDPHEGRSSTRCAPPLHRAFGKVVAFRELLLGEKGVGHELDFGHFQGVERRWRGRLCSEMPPLICALGCGAVPG